MSLVRNSLGTEHFLYRFMMLVLTELYIWTGHFDKASELIQETEVAEANTPFSDRIFILQMKMIALTCCKNRIRKRMPRLRGVNYWT